MGVCNSCGHTAHSDNPIHCDWCEGRYYVECNEWIETPEGWMQG